MSRNTVGEAETGCLIVVGTIPKVTFLQHCSPFHPEESCLHVLPSFRTVLLQHLSIFYYYYCLVYLPGGTSDKESAYQCRQIVGAESDPWMGNIPWRRKWQPTPVFLPEKFHGQRSLAGQSPWGQEELDKTAYTLSTLTHHRVFPAPGTTTNVCSIEYLNRVINSPTYCKLKSKLMKNACFQGSIKVWSGGNH